MGRYGMLGSAGIITTLPAVNINIGKEERMAGLRPVLALSDGGNTELIPDPAMRDALLLQDGVVIWRRRRDNVDSEEAEEEEGKEDEAEEEEEGVARVGVRRGVEGIGGGVVVGVAGHGWERREGRSMGLFA